jgi:exopolysaccharide biosynthesis polyprenyl glycosylphosphotransferase
VHGWFRRYLMNLLMVGLDVMSALLTLRFAGVTVGLALLGALLLVMLNCCSGLNRSRFTLSVLDDVPALVGRSLGVALAVLVAASQLDLQPTPSTLGVLALPLVVVLVRTLGYEAVRSARRHGRHQHRALVLGAGVVGRDLAQAMLDKPSLGLVPVGFVDASPLGGPTGLPVPVVGTPADLAGAIVDTQADHVLIAFTALRESEMVAMLRTCDRLEAEISVVPRLFELAHRERDTDEVDGVTVVRLRRAPFRTPMWRLKRVFDATTSGAALLLLSPLLAAVALAIRVVDGPGILFRQERVGLDEKTFDLLKFRSLKPADTNESDTRWNIKNDDRMSWLGRLLRKTSIDELPQLWNILNGDMSLVGPRPERPHFVATFDEAFPRYGARHRVPTGLTGWAQIHGLRGDTSIEERARFDNYYIENWSLWLDIKIILRTLATLTKGAG